MVLLTPAIAASSHPARDAALGADPVRSTVERAREFLASREEPGPEAQFGASFEAGGVDEREALATLLMDHYRRTRESESFDLLVALAGPALQRRVRYRLRQLGLARDPEEVTQDVLVNVYRYPARFDGARAGAFRAWSSRIVDNAIRRQLRSERAGPSLQLVSVDVLAQERDGRSSEPSAHAANTEECQRAMLALGLLLQCYLTAYQELGERERFVLQMVEIRGMRYAELAQVLGIRPEALKMVVFRARKRIQEKLTVIFARARPAA